MRILIITEGNSDMGFGHVTRCLSLYDAFRSKNIIPEFIIQGDETVEDFLVDTSYRFIDWIDQPERLLPLLRDSDVVFMDSVSVDAATCSAIGKRVRLPVYLDDFNDYVYERGLTIDWTIFADTIHHNRNTYNLLGTGFVALRKEFWDAPEKEIVKEVASIMVTMGGSDIRNLTPRIMNRLRNEYPAVKINVIIGKGFNAIGQIESLSDDRMNLVYFPDASIMKQIMETSDVAISAGGQTLCELARMGVPTIAVSIVDNQQYNIEGLRKAGFIEYAGSWEDPHLEDAIVRAGNRLSDREERLQRSLTGREIVDGSGAIKIVETILDVYYRQPLYSDNSLS